MAGGVLRGLFARKRPGTLIGIDVSFSSCLSRNYGDLGYLSAGPVSLTWSSLLGFRLGARGIFCLRTCIAVAIRLEPAERVSTFSFYWVADGFVVLVRAAWDAPSF